MSERLLIVGWDGADWEILDDLLDRGMLPTVAGLLADGGRGTLLSTIPSHSWAAWPSFLTGLHPSGHGIYDFAARDPREPDRRVPITASWMRATTFLQHLSSAGHSVRAGNIPVTYPPIEVNGRFISGPVVPPGGRYVHPPGWQAELDRRAPFPLNGLEWQRYRAQPQSLLTEAARFIELRTESFRVLLEGDWDVGVCVYVAPDRVQHPLGRYLLPSHPEYATLEGTRLASAARDLYRLLDRELARLIEAAGPDVTVVLMSDHGFRPVTRSVDMVALLVHLGFTTPAAGAAVERAMSGSAVKRAIARTRAGRVLKRWLPQPRTIRWDRTVAYGASSGGILINRRGREPHGIVPPESYDSVLDEVRDALLSFRDPATGEPVVRTVYRREDLPPGVHRDRAPDLLPVSAPLYSFEHTGSLAGPSDWPSGTHRKDGILVAAGPRVRGELGTRSITDLAPTALAFAGIEPPSSDGSAIAEIAGRRPLSDVAVGPAAPVNEDEGSREDQDFMAQHLRDLGYIE